MTSTAKLCAIALVVICLSTITKTAYVYNENDQLTDEQLIATLNAIPCLEEIDASYVDENGRFSEKKLPAFLAMAAANGILDDFFTSQANLTVNNLAKNSNFIGLGHNQMFLIENSAITEKRYLFKEIKTEFSFRTLKLGSLIDELNGMTQNENFPIFVFPKYFFTYRWNGVKHFACILPFVEGKPLIEFLLEYRDAQNNQYIEQATALLLKKIGTVFSNFHRIFKYTDSRIKLSFIGDCHAYNIIVGNDNKLYAIDTDFCAVFYFCQRFSDSNYFRAFGTKKQMTISSASIAAGPFNDIFVFLYQVPAWSNNNKSFVTFMLQNFLLGYFYNFTASERAPIWYGIRHMVPFALHASYETAYKDELTTVKNFLENNEIRMPEDARRMYLENFVGILGDSLIERTYI